jgi:hypothetical protein
MTKGINKTQLYNKSDLLILDKNIPDIIEKHKKLKFENVTVDINEYNRNMSIIKKFIRDKKLLVYGGYAQDQLLKSKGHKGIYNKYSGKDIEFFSPNYMKDLVELANMFNKKKWGGYLGVAIREAMHGGTLTLQVNGFGYVDCTYMPKNIYNSFPYIIHNGIYFVHPLTKMIDFYRVFTDPYLSYFRLDDKSEYKRFKANIEAFTLEDIINVNKTTPKIKYLDSHISKKIRDIIVKNNQNVIIIGAYATEYYKHHNKKVSQLKVPFYEVISTNFIEDVHRFRDELEKIRSKDNFISTKEYYPLFQYTDRRVEYYLKDKKGNEQLILIIFKLKDTCVPYINLPQKKLDIGTYQLTLLYAFSAYLKYAYLMPNEDLSKYYSYIIYEMITNRNSFLKNKNKTVLDETPFKEFVFNCKGKAVDFARKSSIERTTAHNRRGNKGTFLWRYDPSKDSEPDYKSSRFSQPNITGQLITRESSLTLNQKLN